MYSIASPYKTATIIGTGEKDPFAVALSKSQKLLFVTNPSGGTVSVYHYPSMKLAKTLGAKQGLVEPEGISDSPNFTE